jgi:hypothetical protein
MLKHPELVEGSKHVELAVKSASFDEPRMLSGPFPITSTAALVAYDFFAGLIATRMS